LQAAQDRLAELHKRYEKGQNGEQEKRTSYVDTYPRKLLSGILYCGHCGRRFHQSGSNGSYYACPGRLDGTCDCRTMANQQMAEEKILGVITDEVLSDGKWVGAILSAIKDTATELENTVPQELEDCRRLEMDIEKQMNNLIELAAAGNVDIPVVRKRIEDLQGNLAKVKAEIVDLEKAQVKPADLPTEEWVRERLAHMHKLLVRRAPEAAQVIRALTREIKLYAMSIPGRKRGYLQARFKGNVIDLLLKGPRKKDSEESGKCDNSSPLLQQVRRDVTFEIQLKVDLWNKPRIFQIAPEVQALRDAGMSWREIGRRLNCGSGNALLSYRWLMAQGRVKAQ